MLVMLTTADILEYLFCTRYFSECFPCINTFNPPSSSVRQVLFLAPFY